MFKFDVLEVNDFTVVNQETKIIYNIDNKVNYLDEIKKITKYDGKKINFPQMYGSVNFRNNGKGVFYDDSLGYFVCEGDTVESNPSSVFIISGPSYRNRGVNINKSNLLQITSYFAARRSVDSNWKNQKDSYIFDNSQFEDENIFDTVVYSLFNNSSFQSAAKLFEYNGQNFKLKNEFFWMSKERVKELADLNGCDNIYNDVRTSSERYVYSLIYGENGIYDKLSNESKLVLESANNLFEMSFNIREIMCDEYNFLDTWDAGYSQLKVIWKEYFEKEFKEFRSLYKILDNKMKQRTYELGFLK
jgi:hypothetical protein